MLSLRFIWLLGLASVGSAEVRLNGIFADNLVLQRELPVPFWGVAEPGETVTLEFAGQKKTTAADASGKWRIVLNPLPASVENRVVAVKGDRTAKPVLVRNVLVGEVWHCGGQSNMEWGIARSTDSEIIIAAGANPLLRMARVDHNSQPVRVESIQVTWTEASPETVKGYSAVPYLFGAGLQKELGVPVGIINSSYGGTRIESWLDADTLKNGPWPQDESTDVAKQRADYDRKVAAMRPTMDAYLAEKAKSRSEKRPDPPMFDGWPGEFRGPTVLWNGEIAPIAGYGIRGMVWNQGENNAQPGSGPRYQQLLTALARSYRAAWGQGDFPLIVMQLCTYKKPGAYADIREAQLKFAQADGNSALVVTLDQSAPDGDVHYPDKREVSVRTVRAALGLVYQHRGAYAGPVFDQAMFAGGRAVLSFKELGGGLTSNDDKPLRHFELAGVDKKFVPAEARIERDTVVVSAPTIVAPTAVRYAFMQFPWPPANLFNKAGLPASSFRSDAP